MARCGKTGKIAVQASQHAVGSLGFQSQQIFLFPRIVLQVRELLVAIFTGTSQPTSPTRRQNGLSHSHLRSHPGKVSSFSHLLERYMHPSLCPRLRRTRGGFALAGSFWTILILLLAVLSILVLPFRFALVWRRRRKSRGSRARRVVVIGLDGLDPGLTERWMGEGRLPNLQKLAEQGVFERLGTTLPAITPAAWSSFATGTDASRHNIFDFITRDPQTYQPVLSSARVIPARRNLKVGPIASRCRRRACATSSAASRSGSCWERRTFSAPSCGCRLLFHRSRSTAICCLACVCRICAERRESSPA